MRRILPHVGWLAFGFVFLASHALSAKLFAKRSANVCGPRANRHSMLNFQSVSFFGNLPEGMRGLNTLTKHISIGAATSGEGSCNVNLFDQSAGTSAFVEYVSHHVAIRFLPKTSKNSPFKNPYALTISITHQSGFSMIFIFMERCEFSQSQFFLNNLNIRSMIFIN